MDMIYGFEMYNSSYALHNFYLNPILWGDVVLHQNIFPIISILVKLHINVVRHVLEIYFPSFFIKSKNFQQAT